MGVWQQALLMGYDQVREHEEMDLQIKLAGAKPSL